MLFTERLDKLDHKQKLKTLVFKLQMHINAKLKYEFTYEGEPDVLFTSNFSMTLIDGEFKSDYEVSKGIMSSTTEKKKKIHIVRCYILYKKSRKDSIANLLTSYQ